MTHFTPPIKLRPNWHDIRFDMALAIAKRSLCMRDQVGAIIVDISNKVIGEGYNGPPKGFWHANAPCTQWCQRTVNAKIATDANWCSPGEGYDFLDTTTTQDVGKSSGLHPTYDDCPSLHAEANALMMSDRSLRSGGTIYVTSHICMGCAKLIANSGLHSVRVGTSTASDHRRSSASYEFLKSCGLEVYVSES